jgi:hypothetical protein
MNLDLDSDPADQNQWGSMQNPDPQNCKQAGLPEAEGGEKRTGIDPVGVLLTVVTDHLTNYEKS